MALPTVCVLAASCTSGDGWLEGPVLPTRVYAQVSLYCQAAMASPPSPTEAAQSAEPACDSAKSLDPPSPASAGGADEEEPALPEGFGKSFAVRDGDKQGVYIYVPTEVRHIVWQCLDLKAAF